MAIEKADAYRYLGLTDQGKFLIAELEDRKNAIVRDLDQADDCALRKYAGALSVICEILDDFEEHAPPVGGQFGQGC